MTNDTTITQTTQQLPKQTLWKWQMQHQSSPGAGRPCRIGKADANPNLDRRWPRISAPTEELGCAYNTNKVATATKQHTNNKETYPISSHGWLFVEWCTCVSIIPHSWLLFIHVECIIHVFRSPPIPAHNKTLRFIRATLFHPRPRGDDGTAGYWVMVLALLHEI